jgi:hypothetical protein
VTESFLLNLPEGVTTLDGVLAKAQETINQLPSGVSRELGSVQDIRSWRVELRGRDFPLNEDTLRLALLLAAGKAFCNITGHTASFLPSAPAAAVHHYYGPI